MSKRLIVIGVAPLATLLLTFVSGCARTSNQASPQGRLGSATTKAEKFAVSFSASPAPSAGGVAASSAGDARKETASPPRDAGQESQIDRQSFGRIVGVAKWTGPLPKLDAILVNKDAHVCAEHGKHDRESESLIVDASNGGIKYSVVYLFGKFQDGKPLSELKHPDTLNQRVCSYEPHVFVVPVGARLAITSEDEVGHNVRMTGAADLNIAVSNGGRTSRKFEQAGLVKLGCDIHPWMSGYVHVVKHPYYAVTDVDGRLELADVPAGEHQIKLWHEAWWTDEGRIASPIVSTHSVTVRPGETTTVTFELSNPALAQMAKTQPAKGQAKR